MLQTVAADLVKMHFPNLLIEPNKGLLISKWNHLRVSRVTNLTTCCRRNFSKFQRVEIKILELTQSVAAVSSLAYSRWGGCRSSETFRLICLIDRPDWGSYVQQGPPTFDGSVQVSVFTADIGARLEERKQSYHYQDLLYSHQYKFLSALSYQATTFLSGPS